MKIHTIAGLVIAVLGIGGAWLWQYQLVEEKPADEGAFISTTSVQQLNPERLILSRQTVETNTVPEPGIVVRAELPPRVLQPAPLSVDEKRRMAIQRYYDQMERNFTRQLSQLNQETNPARRRQLIQSLSRYVRIDTLEAIDWAVALENPEEKRAALEAINKNALTGIGARIEVDATGLPKIRNTTVLSAVESTGVVEPGDYISGMVNPDGSVVNFHGLPIQTIVQNLRGKPGTEVQLMMERVGSDGTPYSYDVPIVRSMIVMEPTY